MGHSKSCSRECACADNITYLIVVKGGRDGFLAQTSGNSVGNVLHRSIANLQMSAFQTIKGRNRSKLANLPGMVDDSGGAVRARSRSRHLTRGGRRLRRSDRRSSKQHGWCDRSRLYPDTPHLRRILLDYGAALLVVVIAIGAAHGRQSVLWCYGECEWNFFTRVVT